MDEIVNVEIIVPSIKIWNDERVVTFKDIDMLHKKPDGTAKVRFSRNKKRFLEGTDYYRVTPNMFNESQKYTKYTSGINEVNNRGTIFLTETGYLMIVKSFNDDLAWEVQRRLVNTYFNAREILSNKHLPQLTLQSTTPVPLNPRRGFYWEWKREIDAVCKALGWSYKELYHHMLSYMGKKYDLEAAREIYKKELGYYPEHAMDIVDYFPELKRRAIEQLSWLEEFVHPCDYED